MRISVIVLGVCVATTAFASEGFGTIETLVGWSADGERYAVVSFQIPDKTTLVVHDRDTVVATFKESDKGVPKADPEHPEHSGLEKIDVTSWKPIQQYGLQLVTGAARKRFNDTFQLDATGALQPMEKQRCKGSGWVLVRRKDRKTIAKVEAKDDHCFHVFGGYANATGTRALIKISEAHAWIDDHEYMFEDSQSFVLIDIPQ